MVKNRYIWALLEEYLALFPAVGIIGPRQVGKTTLVKNINLNKERIYLDLEKASDRAKLNDAELFLKAHVNKTIILDEIQMMPELFTELRSLIDEKREAGRFIILGSASPELIRSSADSLAGRIGYLELTPFHIAEIEEENLNQLWIRGGFPLSFLANSERASQLWRENFIKTYIERDLGLLGLNTDPYLVERFWRMLAHAQGGLLVSENFAKALGISRPTVNKYLEFLKGSFMVRLLHPYFPNVKKRLVASPKVYIRDSGILHSLAGIGTYEDLINQLLVGHSWEGFVIEQICNALGKRYEYYFYRTHQGAECDLILVNSGQVKFAIEIKNTLSPKVGKGFRISLEDTQAEKGILIYRGKESYPLEKNILVIGLWEFIQTLKPNNPPNN